jgi:hypothetical protein
LYLKKNADQKITTSSSGWNLIADGLKYEHNTTTFNNSLGRQDIKIVKGGDIESKIVYLIKGHPTNAHLQYNEICGMGPSFKQINNYGNQNSE